MSTPMTRMKLAAWLVEAGYLACGQQFAAAAEDQAPRFAHVVADDIDGALPEHDEQLPSRLREWADAQEGCHLDEPLPLASVLEFWAAHARAARGGVL